MMTGSVVASACRAGECLGAGAGSVPASSSPHGLAVAALASWLVAELFGAYMLRSWIVSGGIRDLQTRPRGLSPALIFWHASLALAGLVSWVIFLLTRSVALAWAGVGFLAPAIGLGISTLTVWTPFPVRRPRPGEAAQRRSDHGDRGHNSAGALVASDMLDRALDDEFLTRMIVDELLDAMLAHPVPQPPANRRWQLAPLIPILHGVLAIATFLLAMLAAIAAVAH